MGMFDAFLENPKAKAQLEKMLGRKLLPEAETAAEHLASRRAAAAEALSNVDESQVPRHAEDSARVFQEQLPNSEPVNPNQALVPSKPNFTMSEPEPSGLSNPPARNTNTGFTMSEPGLKNPPAIPEYLERDVTPHEHSSKSPLEDLEIKNHATDYSTPEELSSKGLSNRTKAAIGAGIGGGIGAGIYGLMGNDDKTPSNVPLVNPDETRVEAAPERAPSVEGAPVAVAPKSIKKAVTPEVKAPEVKTPEIVAPKKEEQPIETKPIESPKYLDFGNAEQNRSEIKEVQDRQNMAELVNGLGKAADRIGAGIARTAPVAQEAFDQQIKQAGAITQNYLQRKEQEDSDPNSGQSKAARDYIKQYGINVSDGATANQLKQVMPYVFKDFEAKQAAKNRADDQAARLEQRKYEAEQKHISDAQMLKDKLEQRKYDTDQRSRDRALGYAQLKASKEQAHSSKQVEIDNRDINKLNERLTGDIASSRSAFGRAANNYQAIQNAKALLNGELDPNNLDNRQVFELTRVADRVLSNGNPTQFGSEHLNPDTGRARLAKILEFADNRRHGAQAGDFVKSLSHTLDREEDMAKNQMQRTHKEILGPYKELYERNPDRFGDMLESKNLPRDIFSSEKGHVYRDQPTKSGGSDSDRVNVMSPDGVAGTIPRSSLKKALDAKYKEI